jgi:hypothetical protein
MRMGEETTAAAAAVFFSSSAYSPSFPIKTEAMVPYNLNHSDPYCHEKKIKDEVKAYHEDIMDEYHERPQLHHMTSLSTTCTSDSFHTADSGEISAYDLNATEAPDFEWSANPFQQWPTTRNSLFKELLLTNR